MEGRATSIHLGGEENDFGISSKLKMVTVRQHAISESLELVTRAH